MGYNEAGGVRMATVTTTKYGVSMKFAIGTSSSGATKTMSVSIGQLDPDRYDAGKAFTYAATLAYLYSEVMTQVVETRTSRLTS